MGEIEEMLLLRQFHTRQPCFWQCIATRQHTGNVAVTRGVEVTRTCLWPTSSFRLPLCDSVSLSVRRPCVVARQCITSTSSCGYSSDGQFAVPFNGAELEALLVKCRQLSTVDLVGVMATVAGDTAELPQKKRRGNPDPWSPDQRRRTVIGALLDELVPRLRQQQQQRQQQDGDFDWAAIRKLATHRVLIYHIQAAGGLLLSQLAVVLLEASSGMAEDRPEVAQVLEIVRHVEWANPELRALFQKHLPTFARCVLRSHRDQKRVLLFLQTVHILTPHSYQIEPELMRQLMDAFVQCGGRPINLGSSAFLSTCSSVSAVLVRMRIRDSTFLNAYEELLLRNMPLCPSISPGYAASIAYSLAFFGRGRKVIHHLSRRLEAADARELSASNISSLISLAWAILATGHQPPFSLLATISTSLLAFLSEKRTLGTPMYLALEQLFPFLRQCNAELANVDLNSVLIPCHVDRWKWVAEGRAAAPGIQTLVRTGAEGTITLAALVRPIRESRHRWGVEVLSWPVDPATLTPEVAATLPGKPVAVLALDREHVLRDSRDGIQYSFVLQRKAKLLSLWGWHVALLDMNSANEPILSAFRRVLAQSVLGGQQ